MKRIIGLFILFIVLLSTSFAYSGFNRYYYTDYYKPTYYYSNPYVVPNAYYYPTYTTTYYPTTVVYPAYYPAYYSTYYTSPIVYPSTYTGISVYSSSSGGWGISINRGSVCGIYGYC